MTFYSESKEEVLRAAETDGTGLKSEEAAKRLNENGRNELASQKKKSLFVKFLEQFKDVMIIVLIAAAS